MRLAALLLALVGCTGTDPDLCRFEPQNCPGEHGALCAADDDCDDALYCCLESANCGGGMCTSECVDNGDCPDDMRCEHAKCFYACSSDRECALGMSCEHGETVCEWP